MSQSATLRVGLFEVKDGRATAIAVSGDPDLTREMFQRMLPEHEVPSHGERPRLLVLEGGAA